MQTTAATVLINGSRTLVFQNLLQASSSASQTSRAEGFSSSLAADPLKERSNYKEASGERSGWGGPVAQEQDLHIKLGMTELFSPAVQLFTNFRENKMEKLEESKNVLSLSHSLDTLVFSSQALHWPKTELWSSEYRMRKAAKMLKICQKETEEYFHSSYKTGCYSTISIM